MGNYVCMCFGAQGRAEPCWKARRAVDLHSEMADEDSITICKLKEVERNLESIWKGDIPKNLQTKAGAGDKGGGGQRANALNEAGTLAGEGSEVETFADAHETLFDEHGEAHAANETIASKAGTLDREEALLTKEATRQKKALMHRGGKPRR